MDIELNIQDMEEADYFAALLLKQLRQEITDNELLILQNWKASHPSYARVCERVNDGDQLLADLLALKQVDMERRWQMISAQIETVKKPVAFYRRWYAYAAAAVVLLVAGTMLWRYGMPQRSPEPPGVQQIPAVVNVKPVGNRAMLSLSNGSVINLGNAGNGKLAQEGSTNVVKLKDGELKYEPATGPDSYREESAITTYNTLSTPRGGQYNVVLPDGSQVWLNAASSIKYPTRFAADKRRVTITGEVYFEVASLPPALPKGREGAKKLPFIVTVQSLSGNNIAEVEVLGTSFNIMAYDEEAAIKTTLLNGKVKVSAIGNRETANGKRQTAKSNELAVVLKPGEQAVIAGDSLTKPERDHSPLTIDHSPDIDEVIGWRKGLVTLKNADVRSIMRLLSRWYDVDISYQGEPPAYTFTGTLPLKENLSVVIKVLEYAGVRLNLQQDQHKIIVKP